MATVGHDELVAVLDMLLVTTAELHKSWPSKNNLLVIIRMNIVHR